MKNNYETQYLTILKDILENGVLEENRTGVDTLVSKVPVSIVHDMANGFPAPTVRPLAKYTMWTELEGFNGGITDKKWYQDRKCRIWDGWCAPNSLAVYKASNMGVDELLDVQTKLRDLGTFYPYQWRRFGQEYTNMISEKLIPSDEPCDQLNSIVTSLQMGKFHRRMVCSSWNPIQQNNMALPPCHYAWSVTVVGGRLHLDYTMRANDFGYGQNFNTAFYATQLMLLAREAGLEAGVVRGNILNAHIYVNQIEMVKELLSREPTGERCDIELPTGDIWSWKAVDTKLINYNPLPPLQNKPKVVV